MWAFSNWQWHLDEVLEKIMAGRFVFGGRWPNNRAENSYWPFRRRERAMLRFRQMRSLQKFDAVQDSVCNHFKQERAQYSRDNFKLNRTTVVTEWRQLCSG